MYKEGLPTLGEAHMILEEATQLNPGPWVQHSIYTAQAAQIIADNCKELDSEKAYILGMLHDIGRRAAYRGRIVQAGRWRVHQMHNSLVR